MLNEILTGKASLPSNPVPTPPSQAPVWPPAGYLQSTEYQQIEAGVRRSERSHKLLAAILAVAVAAGVFIFKRGMREAYRRDMAEMNAGRSADQELALHFYVADDPYVSEARRFASEMCACQDKPCAWNVKALAARWQRNTPKPSDERLLAAALEEIDRYTDCAMRLIPE